MSQESRRKPRRPANGRSLARAVGRGAILTAVGLLLVRGATSLLSPPGPAPEPVVPAPAGDEAAAAFAVRFARVYLADPSEQAMSPFLAEGVHLGAGTPPKTDATAVAQAEVSGTEDLGDGESILTVACEFRDARTLYLAVPIARSSAGEVAALGAPSIVAGPGTAAGADADRPRPVLGAAGPEIDSLVSKFLPVYLASSEADDLSYLLVPGAVIQPLAGEVRFVSLGAVSQLGDGEGPSRDVLAAVKVTDPAGGGTYPLVYRLEVERRSDGRWYVAAVEGVSA